MYNYSKLGDKIKRKSETFIKKISDGLSKPKYKFLFQMFYGLLASQSVKLSDISRALEEDITLKKTIDRLSRNLKKFDGIKSITNLHLKNMDRLIQDDTIFCIDHTDIVKSSSKVLEDLDRVRDGSTGKIEDGYKIFEIAALTSEKKMPISVYSELFSTKSDDFISENTITLKGFETLTKYFGHKGVRALDRGFDNNKFYKYFLKKDEKFIIRNKMNRNVIYNGKSVNILKVAKKYKGKYRLDFFTEKNKKKKVKISYVPVKLPAKPEKQLTLVVVYGIGKNPMMLLTNITSDKKIIAKSITKAYLLRWRIEDYFKFKKQQFHFEDIRVQSLKSIKNLNQILTLVISFIGLLSKEQNKTIFIMEIFDKAKAIYDEKDLKFTYYRLADGIKNILDKMKTGIQHLIPISQKTQSQQLSLDKYLDSNVYWPLAA